jgi:hypothetical protein
MLESGRLDEACPALEESLRLDATLVTRMNLAACYEATGRAASALREFTLAAEHARREHNAQLADVADEHVRAIAEKTHRLSIVTAATKEGQTFVLDGKPIEGELGRLIPVDPGPHVLETHAPAHRPWRKVIAVEGQPRVITETVPALEAEKTDVPLPPPQRSNLVPVLFTGGVAVAAIGIGSYFGIRTFEKRDEYERECDANGECSETGLTLQSQARDTALVSTIAFGVGLVAAGACVYFLVTGSAPSANAMRTPFAVRF